jgi:hypothetical protein
MGGAETWLMALLKYFQRGEEPKPGARAMDVCLTSASKVFSMTTQSRLARDYFTSRTVEKPCRVSFAGFDESSRKDNTM